LPKLDTVAGIDDVFDSGALWNLINLDERTAHIELKPRLVSSDLRVGLQAAVHGIVGDDAGQEVGNGEALAYNQADGNGRI
jgi:hypothetical protein